MLFSNVILSFDVALQGSEYVVLFEQGRAAFLFKFSEQIDVFGLIVF